LWFFSVFPLGARIPIFWKKLFSSNRLFKEIAGAVIPNAPALSSAEGVRNLFLNAGQDSSFHSE
jgi:hypothetical protein